MTACTLTVRTTRLDPSAMREALKLTVRSGIASSDAGLPGAKTFFSDAIREAQ